VSAISSDVTDKSKGKDNEHLLQFTQFPTLLGISEKWIELQVHTITSDRVFKNADKKI